MVNGVKSEDYFGTWENVGNGVYFLDDDHDAIHGGESDAIHGSGT